MRRILLNIFEQADLQIEELTKYVARQIALKASRKCPGACTMYGCVHDHNGALCLVMQLYKGSLHGLLDARRDPNDDSRRQPLPVEEAKAFASQIATALAQLHGTVRPFRPG